MIGVRVFQSKESNKSLLRRGIATRTLRDIFATWVLRLALEDRQAYYVSSDICVREHIIHLYITEP